MLKSNLVELLSTFSQKEIKEFGEYACSPFFNKNEAVVKLYDYLIKAYPDFDEKKIEKEYVSSKIFPGVKFNDGFMRTVMFNLNKLAEDYLQYKEFTNDSFMQDKYLLESYDKRRLNKQFERKFKSVYSGLEKNSNIKNEHYFYKKYILEYTFNEFENKQMESLLKIQHARYGDIGNESENLIKFFIISLMRRYRSMLNKRYVYNIDYNLKFIDELGNHLNTHKYDDVPLVEFYFRFIRLMEGMDWDENFQFVKKFLIKNYKIFSPTEAYGLFICLGNVLAVDKAGKAKERFELYKFMLANNLYSPDNSGRINFIEFVSILFMSLTVKEYDWAENFVDKFKHKLNDGEKQNAANFGYARLNFARGNFSKANEYLSKVHFEALFYKVWVKGLQIRIYYEMGWYDEALSQIDSFRHFLSSNPLLTSNTIRINRNFIKFTKRIIAAKIHPQKKDIIDLKLDLQKENKINSGDWLIKKVSELEEKLNL